MAGKGRFQVSHDIRLYNYNIQSTLILRYVQIMAVFCEHGNDHSGFVTEANFLDQVSEF